MGMAKRPLVVLALMLLFLQSGCWSSKEIEDLALYAGMALDIGTPEDAENEAAGGAYSKQNKITATVQVVPVKSRSGKEARGKTSAYTNISGTGDSVFEIFRQYSLRLDRPIIGHHVKVIVISAELLRRQSILQVMDFVLRDNDIRPSTKIFLSAGSARKKLSTKLKGEIPSFYINDMLRNRLRTSKVMNPVLLTNLSAYKRSKRSFILQNISDANGQIVLNGAGIIKGETGRWIGNLSQEDVQCIEWLTNEGKSGAIKAADETGKTLTYETESMKSRVQVTTNGPENVGFKVRLKTEGRLIEDWSAESVPSSENYQKKVELIFKRKLETMMVHLFDSMQSVYKAEVAKFGEAVRIQQPRVWKKVEKKWDETFSEAPISIEVELKITDFGSSFE